MSNEGKIDVPAVPQGDEHAAFKSAMKAEYGLLKFDLTRSQGGGYQSLTTHAAYQGWKVARAASPAPAVPQGWRDFLTELSKQKPEKPDYWSSCGQCERNSSTAEDLLAATPAPTPAITYDQWQQHEYTKVLQDRIKELSEKPAIYTQAPAPAQYKDSTLQLSVGESSFEYWFESYNPANKGDKQRSRDAYAAGMGDPLVAAAPAQGEPFGHFRVEPFGWTDCAKDDEGAIALYERPQEVGLTDEERQQVFRAAENRMVREINLSWRTAVVDEVIAALRAKEQS